MKWSEFVLTLPKEDQAKIRDRSTGGNSKIYERHYRKFRRATDEEFRIKGRECVRRYRLNNPEKRRNYRRNYNATHKQEIHEYNTKMRTTPEWKARRNAKLAIHRENDPFYRLRLILACRISSACKLRGLIKARRTTEILGCSLQEFRKHIEAQFLPGMTWKNRGLRGWHIDHKMPLAKARDEDELYSRCHYTNLRPLWAVDNWRKKTRTPEEYEAYLQAA